MHFFICSTLYSLDFDTLNATAAHINKYCTLIKQRKKLSRLHYVALEYNSNNNNNEHTFSLTCQHTDTSNDGNNDNQCLAKAK